MQTRGLGEGERERVRDRKRREEEEDVEDFGGLMLLGYFWSVLSSPSSHVDHPLDFLSFLVYSFY